MQVPKDGYRKHVALQPETRTVRYDIATTPDGAKVYLDASYLGSTPLSVSIGPHDLTLTLSMEGYRIESIVVQDLPPEGGGLHFGLIEAGIKEELKRKAERHRKRARGLSYVGLGVLVTSIFFRHSNHL